MIPRPLGAWALVGRPGLDPGTLGLKGTREVLQRVGLVAYVVCFQGNALSLVGLVSWCCRNMRPKMRPVLPGTVNHARAPVRPVAANVELTVHLCSGHAPRLAPGRKFIHVRHRLPLRPMIRGRGKAVTIAPDAQFRARQLCS